MAVEALSPRDLVVVFLPQTGSEFSVLFHLPLLFFSFEVDFSRMCFHVRVQLHVKDPHGSGALSQRRNIEANVGFGFRDSASSLCDQVRERVLE